MFALRSSTVGWLLLAACTAPTSSDVAAVTGIEPVLQPATVPEDSCPTEPITLNRATDVTPELDNAAFWLAKLAPGEAARPLLDDDERRLIAERAAALPGGLRDVLDPRWAAPDHVDAELDERLAWMRGRLDDGKWVEGQAKAFARAQAVVEAAETIGAGPEWGSLHFVVAETPLWCVPTDSGFFTLPVDPWFDRNRCASLHLGEAVRAIRRSADGRWTYVEAGYAVGWVQKQFERPVLGPALSAKEMARELGREQAGQRVWLFADHEQLRAGATFRQDPDDAAQVLLPGAEGMVPTKLPEGLAHDRAPLPFTREQLFTQAFAQLDNPYGWGGREGHRDCSRFLLDLFAQFDVHLPRNSAVQAELGTRSVDLSELDEDAKRRTIREAASTGVVLLYMPGHIMLYLGEHDGHDYGISALSEYLVPCAGGPDTVYKLDRVAVTTLELGRGSERRAFIERITRMAVFE
ncbi:MAG: SH3 domain-containing protein [Myxococcales bacterium]|nr:SH3 domain-containing protein [Myxococcales bacterium]